MYMYFYKVLEKKYKTISSFVRRFFFFVQIYHDALWLLGHLRKYAAQPKTLQGESRQIPKYKSSESHQSQMNNVIQHITL